MKEGMIMAFFVVISVTGAAYSSRELRCAVCRVIVQEMEKEISKIDPHKKINLSHRINEKGQYVHKTKQFARSEIHLLELMDVICAKLENYIKVKDKKTKKLHVIPLITDSGTMNPKFEEYDVIHDGDLNRSLKFHCEGILEEFDMEIIKVLGEKSNKFETKVCTDATKLCEGVAESRNAEL